jgi:ankyrin repeat protein
MKNTNFQPHDPYELMITPPNKQAEMIIEEIEKDESNLNLVSDLIVLGANVGWQNECGLTLLDLAFKYNKIEIAQKLIDAGVGVGNSYLDNEEECGWSPLHIASFNNLSEVAKMLVGLGVDVNARLLHTKDTPLHIAVLKNDPEIAKILIDAGARKDIQNTFGKTPCDFAKTEEMKNILGL